MSHRPPPPPELLYTHTLLKRIQSTTSLTRPQAKIITRFLGRKVQSSSNAHRQTLLLRSQFENEQYLYRAAHHDLRSELTNHLKTDFTALSHSIASSFREIDRLREKAVEDVNSLKTDAALELNARKQEVAEERRRDEMSVQGIAHGIGIGMSDLKTDMEMMKLQLVWKWTAGIVGAVGACFFLLVQAVDYYTGAKAVPPKKRSELVHEVEDGIIKKDAKG